MRKRIVGAGVTTDKNAGASTDLDLEAIATVLVTSERADRPVDNAFDGVHGPGASDWVAAEPGDQTVTLVFDAPQTVRGVSIEIEERERERTQEVALEASRDGGATYAELRRQEFTFSPGGATFERESWDLNLDGVTHLRLHIRPHKGGGHTARLTSFAVR